MISKLPFNKNLVDLQPYEPGKPIEDVARELGMDVSEIIKLASNESALGSSPKALKAIREHAKEMFLYPDGGSYALRTKLASFYEVPFNDVVVGNGSNELLEFIGHAWLDSTSNIVVSQYSFIVYRIIAKMFGAKVKEVPCHYPLTHDLGKMLNAIDENTKVVFICNPNNPTGTMVKQAELDRFMKKVPDHVVVVFDEAYAEICLEKMADSFKYVKEKRNCLVLRSFSKAYGLAGLRIGCAMAGNAAISAPLKKVRQPFNTNRMAQHAALAALDDQAFIRRCKKAYKASYAMITNTCNELGLEYVPTVTNFILIKVGDARSVTSKLQKLGTIVRPMDGYGLSEYIRVTFAKAEPTEKFINDLTSVIKG